MDTNILDGIDINFFKRKLIIISLFFIITPLALGTSIFSLLTLTNEDEPENTGKNIHSLSGVQVYAAVPSTYPSISSEIIYQDSKVGLIESYLSENSSPLKPYAQFIIASANKYNLDYRLIAAIAQKESGLCKVIPDGSHNCWGWGIHSKGTLMFDSYEEGIETVSKGLKENYYDKGYTTLEEIMGKYTPLSPGTWAEGVGFYMNQISSE